MGPGKPSIGLPLQDANAARTGGGRLPSPIVTFSQRSILQDFCYNPRREFAL